MNPIVQILTETAPRNLSGKIAVCRGNDANVHFARLRTAHGFVFAFLKNTQEFGLQLEWQLGDLVEEDSSTVGRLEPPNPARSSASEGSALVTKEFAFAESGGYGGAIHKIGRESCRGRGV